MRLGKIVDCLRANEILHCSLNCRPYECEEAAFILVSSSSLTPFPSSFTLIFVVWDVGMKENLQ